MIFPLENQTEAASKTLFYLRLQMSEIKRGKNDKQPERETHVACHERWHIDDGHNNTLLDDAIKNNESAGV